MNHTKYQNKKELQDAGEITQWLQKNIDGIKNTAIGVSMHRDGTIEEIDIGKKLTKAEKKIITDKFPELDGKEVKQGGEIGIIGPVNKFSNSPHLHFESFDNAVVKVFSADLEDAYKCIFLPPEIEA